MDAGLLWKTDQPTRYSHPMDSVYRKILGMKRYMNTIAAEHPDFLMQVTCEIDNDWRKRPEISRVLNQPMRPVYNGPDWQKNEGPWCWSFFDKTAGHMLVFAINHLDLNGNNAFAARLRALDPAKAYLVEDITLLPGGKLRHDKVGVFSGAALRNEGLPVDLDNNPEPCAAYWIVEHPGSAANDATARQLPSPEAAAIPTAVRLSDADQAAGVSATMKVEGKLLRVTIQSPLSRSVNWSVTFAQ